MKKSYLMIAAAAALFAACSSNDTFKDVESEDVLIGFETYHEKSTKATATDAITAKENLTKAHGGFGVWGYKGAPSSVGTASGTPATIDVSGFTSVFSNVQVWYDGTSPTRGFTYAVPKYWDKAMEYVFFAYAPYDGTNASITATTGNITIDDIPSIQNVSTSTGSEQTLVFNGSTTTGVTDYLMATYVTEQKLVAENKTTTPQGTNQNYGDGSAITYAGQQQTVGFTFGHMLSKLQINLQASEQYSGVQYIKVDALSIERMPASASTKASFTQTSPTAPAGAYTPNTYASELQVIGASGTSTSSLYILKDGALDNDGVTITLPTKQDQSFNYYVAPNVADNSATTDVTEKYLLNITYTVHYVDGIEEEVTVEDVDLSSKLTSLLQNNQYSLTIKVALNQIYFDVISITDWVTPIDNQEIEIK